MSQLAKKEENGRIGESRTQSILLSRFWVLKRSADVDGADFLVQKQANDLIELRARSGGIQVFGVVQSKFFEEKNRVKVQKSYVLNEGRPRPEFFCSIHTDDLEGEDVHYFFSAEEIVREFSETECGEYYWFALSNERDYNAYRNPKKNFVLDKIEQGMNKAEGEANSKFIRNLFSIFATPTMHHQEEPNFDYYLKIIDDARVVLVRNKHFGGVRLLEMRRDLYQNQGDFYWGCEEAGSVFLATCLLAHHCDGNISDGLSVEGVLNNLLLPLDQYAEHVITSSMIQEAAEKRETLGERLDKLNDQYFGGMEGGGGFEFVEVVSKLGSKLTVRCSRNVDSTIELEGLSKDVCHHLGMIDILLPSIQRSTEPYRKSVVLAVKAERDSSTKEIVKVVALGPVMKIH